MKQPIACPWEEDCSSCVRRSTCATWMDYVETCYYLYELKENGNLTPSVNIPIPDNVKRDFQYLVGWRDPLRGSLTPPVGQPAHSLSGHRDELRGAPAVPIGTTLVPRK